MVDKKEPSSGIDAITVPTPKPPYAMPKMVRGGDGKMHTVYVDATTNQPISDLKGYTVLEGNQYYQVTAADDANKDGNVDQDETKKNTDKALGKEGHTTATDADHSGDSFHGSTNPMNNYGYHSKPGFVSKLGMLPGGLGLAAKAVNVGWNANNLAATNTARQMMGLAPIGVKDTVKGLAKDQKGQVANVDINGNKYAVGFEAVSPTGRTNLTPTEARNRALTLGGMTEDTTAKSTEKSWASRALDKAFGFADDPDLPDTAPTPSPSPSTRPENMGTSTVGGAPKTQQQAAGLISHPNNPAPKDSLGRVAIDKVDFDRIGLNPAMAAKMKDFQKEAIDQGLKLSVDVANAKRTPEQQAAIEAAGYSKTKTSYHNVGLAVDVSPTAVDEKGRIIDQATLDKSRALAAKYGFGLLDPSWDPAHIQQTVPGETAASLAKREVDAWGNIKMSPEEDLGIRQNSVPTPSPNPGPTPTEVDRNYTGQGKIAGVMAASPEVDRNYTGQGTVGQPSKAFQSQDEKANTGNVSGYRSSFVSQDERASLPDRMGVTPSGLDPVGNSLSPTSNKSVFDSIGPKDNVGKQTVSNAVQANSGAKLGTTPAARAAMGLASPKTATEKAAMARTIAGELSPSTLAGLAKNDPVARAELGAMVATMDNRAASTYGKTKGYTNPSQYNSLMAANLATTNNNYSKYQASLKQAVDDYYAGKITGVPFGATNYYNPDVSNPAWGAKLTDPTKVGNHIFGSLPEYSPDAANRAAAAAMNTMAGTSYSPGKTKDDKIGYQGTGTSFGGKTGQSAGAGYTPGGMNSPSGSGFGYGGGGAGYSNADSPSEGGGRYGGSGLGSPRGGGSGNSSTGGNGYGAGSAGNGTASGGSAGMSGGGGYSPGGMGSPSGSSAGNAGTGGGGLGKNSDGSSNGWGGRSGSV